MTLTLILMRHAKSSWSNAALPDHDRPLNKRGRSSAAAMGGWLRDQGVAPDEVLTSTSTRTLETLAGLGVGASIRRMRELYHAEAETLLTHLNSATGRCVLLLGHNPGMAEFASRIVTAAPDHPRFVDYPTCATLIATFAAASWADVDWSTGTAQAFAIPREVIGD